MLHTETVEGTTLELLRRLQSESMLDSFCLAVGTALYLGHRKSIGLDLFTPYPFGVLLLKDFLETKYGFRTDFLEKNTLKRTINGVKIDCEEKIRFPEKRKRTQIIIFLMKEIPPLKIC